MATREGGASPVEMIPRTYRLTKLVEQANDGTLCLPDFQREFVWTREQLADLLRSVVRGYFIGTLLLLRCDSRKPPFQPIIVRGAAKAPKELHPEILALDGQQRISSLLYALIAPDRPLKDLSQPQRFFIDLQRLHDDPDSDDVVVAFDKNRLDGLDSIDVQFKRYMLPCTRLLPGKGDYEDWLYSLEQWLSDRGDQAELTRYRTELRNAWREALRQFQTFDIPAVELPAVDDEKPETIAQVCAVFEKLNSTGTPLSIYDLMTARLYRHKVRLHDLWAEAIAKNKRLADWSDGKADTKAFGILVLRVVALLREKEVRPRALIELSPEHFAEDWHRAARAMDRALELVELVGHDGFGVFQKKWLPGYAVLPVLAALRAVIDDRKLGESARSDLQRWYWSSVFLERYSSAVESKSRRDFTDLVTWWTKHESEPEIVRLARAIGSPAFSIRDSASNASAVYSGVFCLLALRGARDWMLGENILLQNLQDHHIFPQAYLGRKEIRGRTRVNTVANRTLIGDLTNNKIKDRAPAEYVDSKDIFPNGPDNVVQPHFIGSKAIDAMRAARADLENAAASQAEEAFLRERERAIIEEIRSRCGVEELASDSVFPEAEASDPKAGQADLGPLQTAFWTGLNATLEAKGGMAKLPAPGPHNWYDVAIGKRDYISLSIDSRDLEFACKLYLGGPNARATFVELKNDRAAIEQTIGEELEWDDRPDRKRCQVVQRRYADIYDQASWPELYSWAADRIDAFGACFKPRLDARAKVAS